MKPRINGYRVCAKAAFLAVLLVSFVFFRMWGPVFWFSLFGIPLIIGEAFVWWRERMFGP